MRRKTSGGGAGSRGEVFWKWAQLHWLRLHSPDSMPTRRRGKVRVRQKATIHRVTLDRKTSHFWTRIPTQTHLRRRITEMLGPFGTPLIWRTSEFKRVAGPIR